MIAALPHFAAVLLAFAIVAIASDRIGGWIRRWRLPLITGFLGTGVLAGPYVANIISAETVRSLAFVDQVSLAIIAFAAGNELFLKEIRSRLRAIAWLTVVQLLTTSILGGVAVFLMADMIPFMADIPTAGRVGIAALAGAILVARSPSSAIAIVNELRAKGPFTKTVVGVTMVTDIAVILLFAVCFSVAEALLSGQQVDILEVGILLAEIGASFAMGIGLGWLIDALLRLRMSTVVQQILLLALGYGVFTGAAGLRDWTAIAWGHAVHVEALLICMIASFWVTNYGQSRQELTEVLELLAPAIYVAFFTLTGASLELDVLPATWHIALTFFMVRLFGLWIGNHIGGRIASEPAKHNRIGWMAYVAQAGIALGLAKNVAEEYPTWGGSFATTLIAVIVLNQLVGPPFMKWAIALAGEARDRHAPFEFDGVRDALLFGAQGKTIMLGRTLALHGWKVKIACLDELELQDLKDGDVSTHIIERLDEGTLLGLDAAAADAIVGMMSDAQNLQLCELAFERFGTRTMVVRLNDPAWAPQFEELGVTVIDPRSAVVSLMDRAVRSPTSAALVLGMEAGQDIIDVEVLNQDLHGLPVRDLHLPHDVALTYVHRGKSMISSQGTTVLHAGDRVTLTGPAEALEKAVLRLEG